MAESPDFLPIEFSPYPPSPASYITAGFAGSLTGVQTATLYDLSTPNLFLIKRLEVQGTVYQNPGTTLVAGDVELDISRGLDDSVSSTALDRVYAGIQPGGVGAPGGACYFTLTAPEPIVVRGHNGAGSQLIRISSGGPASVVVIYSFTLLAWALN